MINIEYITQVSFKGSSQNTETGFSIYFVLKQAKYLSQMVSKYIKNSRINNVKIKDSP